MSYQAVQIITHVIYINLLIFNLGAYFYFQKKDNPFLKATFFVLFLLALIFYINIQIIDLIKFYFELRGR